MAKIILDTVETSTEDAMKYTYKMMGYGISVKWLSKSVIEVRSYSRAQLEQWLKVEWKDASLKEFIV